MLVKSEVANGTYRASSWSFAEMARSCTTPQPGFHLPRQQYLPRYGQHRDAISVSFDGEAGLTGCYAVVSASCTKVVQRPVLNVN